jgi:hypothetical protein
MKKFNPGSLQHYSAYFLHKFRTTNGKLSDDDTKKLKKFQEQFQGTPEYT